MDRLPVGHLCLVDHPSGPKGVSEIGDDAHYRRRALAVVPRVAPNHRRGYAADVTYAADPRIDAYFDALPDWQRAICLQVRDLVHAADRDVIETIKRTNRPYFVLEGNICALLAAKDHVNVFLYDGGIVPDPEGIISSGHDNKTARTVAVRHGEAINAHALIAMFKTIIANNRAGGWRKVKPKS